jgi:hypothetical protein
VALALVVLLIVVPWWLGAVQLIRMFVRLVAG